MVNQCVVVGAGHAGGRAVEALRKYQYDGRVVLVGAEASLPLERPPLSKGYLQDPRPAMAPPIRDRQWYLDNDVELHLGLEAVQIDIESKSLRLADAGELPWNSLILATGGRVRRLQVPGADLHGIHYLRTIDDATALAAALDVAQRVVVVGGGFIGLEAASVAVKKCAVTVVEASSTLIGRAVSEQLAAAVEERFTKAGVNVMTNASAAQFLGEQGKVTAVELSDGTSVAADCVVIGVGIEPEVKLALESGIEVDNGIVVDEYCRTSATDVYAVGDVASHYSPIYDRWLRLESWQNAQNQAIAAARNIAGEQFIYSEIPWFWSDQLDFKIQVAGTPYSWDSVQVRDDGQSGLLFFLIKNRQVVGLQSIGALKDMRRARKLLEARHAIDNIELSDLTVPVKDLVSAATQAAAKR